jgi:hypothetical protein
MSDVKRRTGSGGGASIDANSSGRNTSSGEKRDATVKGGRQSLRSVRTRRDVGASEE